MEGRTKGRKDRRTERLKDGKPKTMSLRFSSKSRGTKSSFKSNDNFNVIEDGSYFSDKITKLPVLELFYEILKISPDFTAGSPFTIFLFHKLGTCANCSNLIALSLFKRQRF